MGKIKKISIRFSLVIIICLLFSIFLIPNSLVFAANQDKVYLGGDTIGLKLETGVYIAGKYDVLTENGKKSPWIRSDIEIGDKIVKFNYQNIVSVEDLKNILSSLDNTSTNITVSRKGKNINTVIDVCKTENNKMSIGLYLKDQMLGVGTMTFINPDNNIFASLGHGIIDDKLNFGQVNGQMLYSNVETIKKGLPGNPGEKRASLTNDYLGTVISNSATGVYGKIMKKDFLKKHKLIEVAEIEEVNLGSAYILTVIKNQEIKKFDVEIIEVVRQNNRNIKGLKIKITDPELIDQTGGIIQGMSGSPIIQNNKLVGAVSHVTIDNPTIGYGMYAKWMLQETNNL